MTDDGLPPVMDAAEEPPKDTSKEWVLDAAARARIDEAYAEIEAVQSNFPKCVVCGQRCTRLDRFGTCSKSSEKSEPHRQHRNEMRVKA